MSARVFRFIDPVSGAPQISKFPDAPPAGDTDLEVRIEHFTEIENFSFLAHVLAHELFVLAGGGDEEKAIEQLAADVLDVGVRWEHLVASTDGLMIPGQPLKISDLHLQAKIDEADEQTEALVDQINQLALKEFPASQESKKAR